MRHLGFILTVIGFLVWFGCSSGDDDGGPSTPVDDIEDATGDLPVSDTVDEVTVDETIDEGVEDPQEEEAVVSCDYPENEGTIECGEVMRPLFWEGASWGDDEDYDFSLEDFQCSDEWDDYVAVIFIITTEWCTYCPDYLDMIEENAAALHSAGALLVFVDAENRFGGPANNISARYHCQRELADPSIGICVGDFDTQPTSDAIYNMPSLSGVPTGFVVRRSDMMVVADQSLDDYTVDYVAIVENIDEASCEPPAPNCGAEDEEIYEPNDTAETRAAIPGDCYVNGVCSFDGGICTNNVDFYQIDLENNWRLDLTFSHATGDLDTYVWDLDSDGVLLEDGNPVGSESMTDNESFTYSGPAPVVIWGYRSATAPYTLTITDLGP